MEEGEEDLTNGLGGMQVLLNVFLLVCWSIGVTTAGSSLLVAMVGMNDGSSKIPSVGKRVWRMHLSVGHRPTICGATADAAPEIDHALKVHVTYTRK